MGPKLPALFSSRPTKIRFGVLGFACSLSLITYLDRICMMRVKEPIQNELQLSDTQMGWIFSIFLVGYGLFEVPGGWMGDNWGARRVLTRVVLWWSLFTAFTGCVWAFAWDFGSVLPLAFNSFALLVFIRFLFGAGEAAAFPNLTRVVRNWFPFQERAFAAGAIWMSARAGGAVAPTVIGALARWVGWRPAFWILGLLGVTWSVLFYWWFRDLPEEKAECNDAERAVIRQGSPPLTGSHASGHSLPPLGKLAGSVTIWAICLVSACVSFGWYFIPTWQPQYYKDVHGISYDNSEIVTGLPFLFGAAGCLLGGRLSDRLVVWTGSPRWGRSLLGIVGFSLAGLCIVGMGFAATAGQAIVLLCLANLVNDMAIPVVWAVCADIGGRYVGSVAGLMNMIGAVGGMLSPLLIPVVLKLLPPLPNLAAKAAAGLPLLAMTPDGWEPVERWRIIFIGLAGAWFIGAVAWVFVNASKPVFEEKGEQETLP
jgi:MFS transporter, ACS family, glucarate transporter